MKRNFLLIPFFIFVVTILFFGGRYWFIKDTFKQPYKVAGMVVEEAHQDKRQSVHVITEEEWREHTENSVYKIIRQPLDWEEFKEYIQTCEKQKFSSLLYSDGKADYKVAKSKYKGTYNEVNIECIDYAAESNDVLEVNYITLLLEKINGDWKVVGQSRNDGISGYYHDSGHALDAARNFINAIKHKNEEQLLALIKSSNLYSRYDLSYVSKMIEGFEQTFDLPSLEVELNDRPANSIDGQFEFVLHDDGEEDHEGINVFLIRYEGNGDIYYNHPYIRYFPFAEEMVTKYVDLIVTKNVEELGQFIKPMDGGPERVAEDRIASYQKYFGNVDLAVRHEKGFVFTVENEKGKEHQIEVVFSDGLMTIDDKFSN
ncbi:hypothetical protein DS745_03785 [Anaerobacillus alkaliphilus]|uniref:Uncharacterized protein n=1 Tax=Anaerobacillus alkaliphilus TaxID=1548597 RepID=A0A4Q0VXU4_9BACI|nr:hypothetical protein [Anaerobacillus alkaliphilus]RXJ04514.1 hypothetical protein DS745_03785 [Anaerobacillus alkaliphilus]